MSRVHLTHVVVASLAIAFFGAPVALRAAGVETNAFENHRLARSPKLSQGWNAFPQATRYLVDRMPLREQAVHLNTRIWLEAFGTDPRYGDGATLAQDGALPFAGAIDQEGNPRDEQTGRDSRAKPRPPAIGFSVTGPGGWSYFALEFVAACDTTISDETALERWAQLVRLVREQGHPAVFLVAPDKASVYPEHLPSKYRYDDCAPQAKENLWRLLADEGPALGVRELRSELVRRKTQAGDDLYPRGDSHWSTLGALTLIDTALDAIGDGVRFEPDDIVRRRRDTYQGDLAGPSGLTEPDKAVELDIRRPRHAPRVPGRTLLVGDSFAYKWMKLIEPYFDRVHVVEWSGNGATVASEVRRSDTVILESAERFFKELVSDDLSAQVAIKALQDG